MDNTFKFDKIEFPKKIKKYSITKEERKWRNERERRRTKSIKNGFSILALKLPSFIRRGKDVKKLTKLEILNAAIEYIMLLDEYIKNGDELYNETDLISHLH